MEAPGPFGAVTGVCMEILCDRVIALESASLEGVADLHQFDVSQTAGGGLAILREMFRFKSRITRFLALVTLVTRNGCCLFKPNLVSNSHLHPGPRSLVTPLGSTYSLWSTALK